MAHGGYLKETLLVHKTADETVNNSAVFQDDDHLTLPLIVAVNYLFEFHLFIHMNTGGIKISVNGPALNTLDVSGIGADNGGSFTSTRQVAYDISTLAHGAAGAVGGFALLSGFINVSAAGNLVLRWAQNAAVANNTTLCVGSWMRLIRT